MIFLSKAEFEAGAELSSLGSQVTVHPALLHHHHHRITALPVTPGAIHNRQKARFSEPDTRSQRDEDMEIQPGEMEKECTGPPPSFQRHSQHAALGLVSGSDLFRTLRYVNSACVWSHTEVIWQRGLEQGRTGPRQSSVCCLQQPPNVLLSYG